MDSELDHFEASETIDEKTTEKKLNTSSVLNRQFNRKISVSGRVGGRNCIIVDDMIDTGRTAKNAIEVCNFRP